MNQRGVLKESVKDTIFVRSRVTPKGNHRQNPSQAGRNQAMFLRCKMRQTSKTNSYVCLAGSVSTGCDSRSLGYMFEPHGGCGDYLKIKKEKSQPPPRPQPCENPPEV